MKLLEYVYHCICLSWVFLKNSTTCCTSYNALWSNNVLATCYSSSTYTKWNCRWCKITLASWHVTCTSWSDDVMSLSTAIMPFAWTWCSISAWLSEELSFNTTDTDDPKWCFHCSPEIPSNENMHGNYRKNLIIIRTILTTITPLKDRVSIIHVFW